MGIMAQSDFTKTELVWPGKFKLPRVFTREIYAQKCNAVYQHIFESYYGEGRSVYAGVWVFDNEEKMGIIQ